MVCFHVRPCAGSSPRVRGTRYSIGFPVSYARFIPACAGNTSRRKRNRCIMPVHPRVCGEHVVAPRIYKSSVGSSPRVRGTRLMDNHGRCPGRFIPACAGNTSLVRIEGILSPVHPRVCGEHCWHQKRRLRNCGSSPRVRGTRDDEDRRRGIRRFIPACAGNTWPPAVLPCPVTVHPRVCGEHFVSPLYLPHLVGSSPRVRGTLTQNDAICIR